MCIRDSRFSELEGRVSKSGLTFPVTTDVRITTHGLPNNQVQIISVNTCRACGAIRPSAANADYDRAVAHELGITLDQYHDARKKAAASTADPREVLDIPMLHPEDYTKLVTASQDAARKGGPDRSRGSSPLLAPSSKSNLPVHGNDQRRSGPRGTTSD